MIVFYLFFLFSFQIFADDRPKLNLSYDPVVDIISDNYESGPYLIYDCLEKHWVCVLENYFTRCEEQRGKDLSYSEGPAHSCAPIGKFPNKISCFQRQLFLTTHNYGDRFCIKDNWKQKK